MALYGAACLAFPYINLPILASVNHLALTLTKKQPRTPGASLGGMSIIWVTMAGVGRSPAILVKAVPRADGLHTLQAMP